MVSTTNSICITYLVTALQSSPHHRNISDTLEAIVNTTISEINEHLLNWFIVVLWIHKFSNSKILCCCIEIYK